MALENVSVLSHHRKQDSNCLVSWRLLFCIVLLILAVIAFGIVCSNNAGQESARRQSLYLDNRDDTSNDFSCVKYYNDFNRDLRSTAAKLDLELRKLWNNKYSSSAQEEVVRMNTVLMAYKRSGSSFVGQILNQHPDVLYLYEPLYFMKSLANKHSRAYRLLSQRLIKIIFTCRFREHPYYVSQLSDSPFRLYSRALSQPPMCSANIHPGNLHDHCSRLDPSTMADICQSHRHVVMKSIRVESLDSLKEFKEFNIEMPWNMLRVVHLVRDPRAIISSRLQMETPIWSADLVREKARSLCTRMLNNLQRGASEYWHGTYHVIRYEDVASEPERAAIELYEFLRLPTSSRVYEWLEKNTNGKHDSYAFSMTKNATVSLSKWRLSNNFENILNIEQECSLVMVLLGYKRVTNVIELRNLSKAMFFANEEKNIFVTQKIRYFLLEIEKQKQLGM